MINREEADVLCGRLDALLDKQLVAGWYDGTARILNEVDILYGKGLAKRPDRVMIYDDQVVVVDYKFGQKESKTYISQMKEYVGLIRQMDYKQVTGYIWYVELDKIEAV